VLKEKAGMNVLVQPTAGDNVIVPMVGRGEAEIGITNIMEAQDGFDGPTRTCASSSRRTRCARRSSCRKDSGMQTIADLKGKRVAMGYSAMRNIDKAARAMLATAGLTEADVRPVLVPNVVRSADDFMAGNADMFYFAFGGRRCARPTPRSAASACSTWTRRACRPRARSCRGVTRPRSGRPDLHRRRQADEVYSFDNVLLTHAKVKDEIIYKILEMLEANKPDLIAVQPVLREFSSEAGYKQYGMPYHPGALKYFKERNLAAKPIE
jgi:hypothetical protein